MNLTKTVLLGLPVMIALGALTAAKPAAANAIHIQSMAHSFAVPINYYHHYRHWHHRHHHHYGHGGGIVVRL